MIWLILLCGLAVLAALPTPKDPKAAAFQRGYEQGYLDGLKASAQKEPQ